MTLEIDGLGPTLFCHGSPRSDEEKLTRATGEERLGPILEGVAERVVVCGHTHQQFDRDVAGHRLLNAGSVGMPYEGDAAAFWLLLGPDAELRRTDYDIPAAAEVMRATGMPDVDEVILRESLLEPRRPRLGHQASSSQASRRADQPQRDGSSASRPQPRHAEPRPTRQIGTLSARSTVRWTASPAPCRRRAPRRRVGEVLGPAATQPISGTNSSAITT